MGTHNWHIVPFLESASFKKRYVLSNNQLQLQSHSKPQLQLLKTFVINNISIQLQLGLLQACIQLISSHPGETDLLHLPAQPGLPHLLDQLNFFVCTGDHSDQPSTPAHPPRHASPPRPTRPASSDCMALASPACFSLPAFGSSWFSSLA